jgi:cyclophilin family peptidyl-prolyl cis-trans isomerase/plastocyanin
MRRALVLLLLVSFLTPFSTAAQQHDYRSGQTVIVTASSKPIREQPATDSRVVTTVNQGDLLEIVNDNPVSRGDLTWWQVRTVDTDKKGWLEETIFGPYNESISVNTGQAEQCWPDDAAVTTNTSLSWNAAPSTVIDPEATYLATLTTAEGNIVIELDAAQAPIATNNFVCLANAGYYDGTNFHRVSSDFLIQGGDPSGTGAGGPGYVIPSDPTTGDYPEGSIALANSEPNQNGSQFFIAASDLTGQIPNDYPVFGQVISGQDIVTEISEAPVEPNPRGELSQPIEPITIQSIEITEQEDEVGPPLPTPGTIDTPTATTVPTVEAAPTVSLPPTDQTIVELDAKDIAFVPTEITVDAEDLPVTIRMTNSGAALHNFTIDALNIDVDVNPGETVDVVIPAGTAPGTYDFYCNVPGHKEAGMVGTLVVESLDSADVPATDAACDGFATYTFDYDNAGFDALDANPAAVSLFENYDDDEEDWFFSLTPAELGYIGDLFADIGRNLELVDAPEFAQPWHELQIEAMQLLASIFESAQDAGWFAASLAFDERATALEQETRAVLDRGSGCPAFDNWAREESIGLDDESSALVLNTLNRSSRL